MKILKIIHGYPPLYNAGSEVYSQSICNELSKSHEVHIFTREENPYAVDFSIRVSELGLNLNMTVINMARAKDGYRHRLVDDALDRLIQRFRPDVAHVGHLNHLSTGLIDVLVANRVPIIFTLHDFWLMCPRGQFLQRNFSNEQHYELCSGQENRKCADNCYSMYFSQSGYEAQETEEDILYWETWIGRRMRETLAILDKVDMFIAPSKYLMNRFSDAFNTLTRRLEYLDYGFPTHYLTPIENNSTLVERPYRFGYIGTHIPSKGVNLMIEAFEGVCDEAELLIWGYKDAQSTRALQIKAEKFGHRVKFLGAYVNQNLAIEVFSKIDCIIVPSIWGENSPLVIHEAQACRLPVITADYGGMSEYVKHDVNGLLFHHRDPESLAHCMRRAAKEPGYMCNLGKRGYLLDELGQVPTIHEHCQKLEELYTKAIQNYG